MKGHGRVEQRELAKSMFFGASVLRGRGWTDAVIQQLLGEPDQLWENPVYPSKAPMRVWARDRVLKAEASSRFAVLSGAARKRVESARRAAETRRQATIGWAERVPIEVVRVEDPVAGAIRSYNDRVQDRAWDDDREPHYAARTDAPAFLRRITVNWLRHECSSYEDLLVENYGRTGVEEALQVIRRRVYEAIAVAYPDLAGECRRQLKERLQGEKP